METRNRCSLPPGYVCIASSHLQLKITLGQRRALQGEGFISVVECLPNESALSWVQPSAQGWEWQGKLHSMGGILRLLASPWLVLLFLQNLTIAQRTWHYSVTGRHSESWRVCVSVFSQELGELAWQDWESVNYVFMAYVMPLGEKLPGPSSEENGTAPPQETSYWVIQQRLDKKTTPSRGKGRKERTEGGHGPF